MTTVVENGRYAIDAVRTDLPLGAHLVASRRGYTHHGIYVGAGKVVHYAGLCRGLHRGPVEEVSLECFSQGHKLSIKADRARYGPSEVVRRARSRLGENRYQLSSNNCEHFCEWCISGESRSEQIETIRAFPRSTMLAAHALLQTVVGRANASFRTHG
jgi:hypothetical protein